MSFEVFFKISHPDPNISNKLNIVKYYRLLINFENIYWAAFLDDMAILNYWFIDKSHLLHLLMKMLEVYSAHFEVSSY